MEGTTLKQKRQKDYLAFLDIFAKNVGIFLRETGLHALKFVGDKRLTNWERTFFLAAFVAALITTCHLISNIYAKWESTPVIIGISAQATSIRKIPFPAVTICNMNQVQRTKVANYSMNSTNDALLKFICNEKLEDENKPSAKYENLWKDNLESSEFLVNHAQTCKEMLIYCRFSLNEYNCTDLFRAIITDEGLCCVFNLLPFEILFKPYANNGQNLTTRLGYVPVAWNPETGYPEPLPPKFLPVPAVGTGISLGFTMVLDAQIDEYYCSSTSAPGFKVFFHNPIEMPSVKDSGLLVAIGHETNFRLEVVRSEAVAALRSMAEDDRQCIFKDERKMLFYNYYTRRNCEKECDTKFLYQNCGCIPHTYPGIYSNASTCGVQDSICIKQSQSLFNTHQASHCRQTCFPSCFDLKYLADAFSAPLANRNFKISNKLIGNMNKTYLQENIAVVHLYYRESVYHGDTKNVYIGLTEFLSNIGGVMGLFLGFSFISLVEMFYFLVLKPVYEFIIWKRSARLQMEDEQAGSPDVNQPTTNVWIPEELYPKRFSRSHAKIGWSGNDSANLQPNRLMFNKAKQHKIFWVK